jgi:hypothetical protein
MFLVSGFWFLVSVCPPQHGLARRQAGLLVFGF